MERFWILVVVVALVGCVEEREEVCELPPFGWTDGPALDYTEHIALVDGAHVHMCGTAELGEVDPVEHGCEVEDGVCLFGFVTDAAGVTLVCECRDGQSEYPNAPPEQAQAPVQGDTAASIRP